MFRSYTNVAMLASLLFSLPITVAAQSTPTVLCFPGQCLLGHSNTSIGATLSSSSSPVPVHLLPGTYTTTSSPQLLHDSLTASSATISATSGFTNSSSISLPLNLALQPGLSAYSGVLYSGPSNFQTLPTIPVVNTSISLTYKSFAPSNNVWIAINSGSSSNIRIVVWDAIPDTSQLPPNIQGSFALTDVQSAACSPSCSAVGGVCNTAGICQCLPGFTGSSCESCASGFFGPTCQSCPGDCKQCDDGISGSGRCLKPIIANDPAGCNCLNGVCDSNGQCSCNLGFTSGNSGLACSNCDSGFFQTTNGDCQVCQIGCSSCADGTGACQTCNTGFTKDADDPTKCTPPTQSTSSGTICPSGSFPNGASCTRCSSACQTCTGPTSDDCIVCASGSFTLNGNCVSADANGVCQGTNLIADNNKRECDTCGAKCTKCRIPNFTVASTVNQKQCTECLPGFFLSRGTCVDACPTGTTISSQDNRTCITCDSSCSTCSGTSTFCLTCANNQFASNGKCVSSCPSGTLSSSGACLPCHPDCASCSAGGSFNQCTSCPASRPVLSNGRCLPTCAKNQFFDGTGGTCQKCDDSCSSCSGAGPSNCLACSSSSHVLRGGTCFSANCPTVVPGLGACLSELVTTQTTDSAAAPLPTVTGIDSPTAVPTKRGLTWWQILLIVFLCFVLLIAVLWFCSSRQRKKAKQAEKAELHAIGLTKKKKRNGWMWRLMRRIWELCGRRKSGTRKAIITSRDIVHLGPSEGAENVKLGGFRDIEESGDYKISPSWSKSSATPVQEEDKTRLLDSHRTPLTPNRTKYHPRFATVRPYNIDDAPSSSSDVSTPSLYSHVTGLPGKIPDPKTPIRKGGLVSKFSGSTYLTEQGRRREEGKR